jgi:two-component system response regulator HydG
MSTAAVVAKSEPRPAVHMRQRVLVVDNEASMRFVLHEVMEREGYEISEASDGDEAVDLVRNREFDLVIMDIRMPRLNGLEALRQMRQLRPHLVVVMITAYGNETVALEALRSGAYDYFHKPFEIDELRVVVRRALERARLMRQVTVLREQLAAHRPFDRIVGSSPAMQSMIHLIEQVAPTDATVLVLGQSGTGKELVAEALHRASARRDAPLVKVNCAAIPEALLESELFGHERGAFTGAVSQRMGKFELADGGTIFLDEVAELPHGLQAKLLRALQEREIERVGGSRTIGVDVRLVAATNRDLEAEVRAGRFRDDLYFRLHVVPIQIPPLRERPDDIPLLAEHFLQIYGQKYQKQVYELTPQALAWCRAYPWPGNVRELENVIQRGVLLAQGATLGLEALPQGASTPSNPLAGLLDPSLLTEFGVPLAKKLEAVTETIEAAVIRAALAEAAGKRQEAANLLGISRKSLFNKMLKYGLFE